MAMRAKSLAIIWLAISVSPLFCLADSAIIAPKPGLWRLISEENQIAIVNISENGFVDVHLFISLVDKSGKSNTIHLVLPFYDKPLSLQAEELVLTEFRKRNVEPLEEREREIKLAILEAKRAIENDFRLTLVSGFPTGLLFWGRLLEETRKALAPGLHFGSGGAPTLTPEVTVTTEHTRTEVYRVRQAEDVDKLLSDLKVAREQLDRLKRKFVGRYLYLVTAKTVPLKTNLQSSPLRGSVGMVSESERIGVVFHVKLEASRNGQALTFTYPLGTGETWANPISLTELFILAPRDGSLQIRYPKIAPNISRLPPHHPARAPQQALLWRDEIGHIAHLAYINSNPSEDVVIVFDPKRPSTVISKVDVERIARFSFLPFLALLVALWFPMVWLFQVYAVRQTKPLGSFLSEATVFGLLWVLTNASISIWGKVGQNADKLLWLMENYLRIYSPVFFAFAVLFVTFAFLPSMRPHRLTLLLSAILTICFPFVLFLVLPLTLVLGYLTLAMAPLLNSLVILVWFREGRRHGLRYWHCLEFSLIFGISVALLSLLVRQTLFQILVGLIGVWEIK